MWITLRNLFILVLCLLSVYTDGIEKGKELLSADNKILTRKAVAKQEITEVGINKIFIDQPKTHARWKHVSSIFDKESTNEQDRNTKTDQHNAEASTNKDEPKSSIFRNVNEMRKQGIKQGEGKAIEQKVVSKLKELKEKSKAKEEDSQFIAADKAHQSIFSKKSSAIHFILTHIALCLLI